MFFKSLKRAWLFFGLIALSAGVSGQIPVSGKVTSAEDNQGMPGVNVLIKGTSQGVITGNNRSYTISIRNIEDILVLALLDSIPREMSVGSPTTINVTLVPGITSLETVVVMGYS